MGIFNPFEKLIKSVVDKEFNRREQEVIDSASKEIEQYLIAKDEDEVALPYIRTCSGEIGGFWVKKEGDTDELQ